MKELNIVITLDTENGDPEQVKKFIKSIDTLLNKNNLEKKGTAVQAGGQVLNITYIQKS